VLGLCCGSSTTEIFSRILNRNQTLSKSSKVELKTVHCNTSLLKLTGTVWLGFIGTCGQGEVVQVRYEWKSTVRSFYFT